MTTFGHDPLAASRLDAAKRLAALVTLETGVVITPDQMLALVRDNWDRIAAFAHQIHGTERKAPADEGWIEWKGGMCPVTDGTRVTVRFRNSDEYPDYTGAAYREDGNKASGLYWKNDGEGNDITAYRVVKP